MPAYLKVVLPNTLLKNVTLAYNVFCSENDALFTLCKSRNPWLGLGNKSA